MNYIVFHPKGDFAIIIDSQAIYGYDLTIVTTIVTIRGVRMAITISKGKLKAKMLEVFRKVENTGEELIVTDHGKPVLRIIPIRPQATVHELFKEVQGQVAYLEDINTPTLAEWEDA